MNEKQQALYDSMLLKRVNGFAHTYNDHVFFFDLSKSGLKAGQYIEVMRLLESNGKIKITEQFEIGDDPELQTIPSDLLEKLRNGESVIFDGVETDPEDVYNLANPHMSFDFNLTDIEIKNSKLRGLDKKALRLLEERAETLNNARLLMDELMDKGEYLKEWHNT